METVTIPQADFFFMQQKIADLEQQMALLRDEQFMQKLQLAYQFFIYPKQNRINYSMPTAKLSLKRGSAKHLITYIAEDFNAPLEDFKDYI